ncbi:hypothetical protein [Microlunatus flavus]|uniref:Uncharacterized protein n=1 Tax=Microlunatus flavus TaxID=1036181 RepID=A0A1H9IJR9_9ACTN|nr:hypothetical protein [Microlunatus flavus]SEQ74850.1 hypothetical protein SAMN05421756_105280 [Microlunatus flavus]
MAQTLAAAQNHIEQLPPVPTLTLGLAPGIDLEFVSDVPDSAADRRLAVRNSTLYAIIGHRTDTQLPFLGGYVGMSQALHSTRAGISWTHWVVAQRAIRPTGMALLHCRVPPRSDQLLVLESRVIQRLSTDLGTLALTNTHTAAETAAGRLAKRPRALQATLYLADTVAEHLHQAALGGRHNPWPAPAPNAREAAVRIVLRASQLEGRALDTTEVVERLAESGYTTNGSTRWRSVRRDLTRREQDTHSPRIRAVNHRARVVYHAPALGLTEALREYDRVHPRHGG